MKPGRTAFFMGLAIGRVFSSMKDGTIYYMGRREDTFGGTDIYLSRDLGNSYGEAENLGVPINSVESDQDPFIAPDGSYLVVCLTGRKDGFGKYDLYVSSPDGNGGWSEPVNLGEGVNTEGSEFRPYVTADGKHLFFTSPDPENGKRGRIYWVSTRLIHERLAAD
jgi:Tol biopolymer transport system component